jgi:2-(1,2-epoxy-1,2-dihydrophenyl)acetyl-CoA isomerase
MSQFNDVAVQSRNDVSIIELAAPSMMNALSLRMVEELILALKDSAQTSRCVLITGQGRGFCSGANLGGVLDPNSAGYDAGAFLQSHYNPLMRAMRELPIPIVVAVNGAAAGFGATLALAGDLIVASRSAYFIQSFRNIGLIPDGGSASLLLQLAGRARALEMMLLGERIPAAMALDWGMINRVVEPEQLLDASLELAVRLATGPTVAIGMMRRLAWEAAENGFDIMLNRERDLQNLAGQTVDHREGIAAFLSKRSPNFIGR